MKLRCWLMGHKWVTIGADEICKRCGSGKEEPVSEVEVVELVKEEVSLPESKDLSAPIHKDVAIEDVIDLVDKKGMSHAQAAKQLDVTRQAISYLCKAYAIKSGAVDKYRTKELDLIDYTKRNHLYSLARSTPNPNKPLQSNKIFTSMFDRGLLAAGKPTAHVLYGDVTKSQAQVRAELESMGYKIEDIEEEE